MVSAIGRRFRFLCSVCSSMQRVANRLEPGRQRARDAERVEAAAQVVVLEQIVVADGEQRPAQRGIHRQLIVGPLDGQQRRAQRLDLLAVVKGLAADQQVADTARFQCVHVVARHVLAVRQEAAEQDADVPRFERYATVRCPPLRHRPSAVLHQPRDVRADRVGQRRLDRARSHEPLRVRAPALAARPPTAAPRCRCATVRAACTPPDRGVSRPSAARRRR